MEEKKGEILLIISLGILGILGIYFFLKGMYLLQFT